MAVIVAVGVAAPLIVAALVSRNVPVKVIDTVDDRRQSDRLRLAHGGDHAHGSVPVHERGHHHGGDNAHDEVHGPAHELPPK